MISGTSATATLVLYKMEAAMAPIYSTIMSQTCQELIMHCDYDSDSGENDAAQ